jgi:hypothetical protein
MALKNKKNVKITAVQSSPPIRLYAVSFCFLLEAESKRNVEESLVVLDVRPPQKLSQVIKEYAQEEIASFKRVYSGGDAIFLGVNEISRIYDPLAPGCEISFSVRGTRNLTAYRRQMFTNSEINTYARVTSKSGNFLSRTFRVKKKRETGGSLHMPDKIN